MQIFDTNRDGRIATADARFADLRVWQGKNGDGSNGWVADVGLGYEGGCWRAAWKATSCA